MCTACRRTLAVELWQEGRKGAGLNEVEEIGGRGRIHSWIFFLVEGRRRDASRKAQNGGRRVWGRARAPAHALAGTQPLTRLEPLHLLLPPS